MLPSIVRALITAAVAVLESHLGGILRPPENSPRSSRWTALIVLLLAGLVAASVILKEQSPPSPEPSSSSSIAPPSGSASPETRASATPSAPEPSPSEPTTAPSPALTQDPVAAIATAVISTTATGRLEVVLASAQAARERGGVGVRDLGSQCVLYVVAPDAAADTVLYARGFEHEGWTDAGTGKPTDGPIVHQEVISPPQGVKPGATWTGSVEVAFGDGRKPVSRTYQLQYLTNAPGQESLSLNGSAVRCVVG